MSKFHDPNDPRHMRLFELLRQKHAADTIVGSVKGFQVRHVNKEELDKIKHVAARSMARVN
jgi:hypothetical protein